MDTLWLSVIILTGAHLTWGFSMVVEGDGQQVDEGDHFSVMCETDSYYEFCIFVSPTGYRCEFEWKRNWNISRSECPELETRTSFLGDYEQFQCGLKVEEARVGDSGIWGCEMESYKFGGGRGSGYVVRGGVEVEVRVATTTTTSTTTTQSTTRASLWPRDLPATARDRRKLWDVDLGFNRSSLGSIPDIPDIPTKTDLTLAYLDIAGLMPIIVTSFVIIVFIIMFSVLVVAHKRKAAALVRVKATQVTEEPKEEHKEKEQQNEEQKNQVHNAELEFMRKVFPHIITLPEHDLGLNL